MTKAIFYLSIASLLYSCTHSSEVSQWRGPNRDGKYAETNLLKQWPENGPGLRWSFEGLGEGHGNVGIGQGKLFVCGMPDTTGVIYAFDMQGELLWKKEYGLEWHLNYTGSRSTPTVVGDMVYFESGQGVVYCYNGNTGDLIWSVDLLQKFNAQNIKWGMTESLLIDGDVVYCTPGGAENNVVALNRFNGETIWTSPGNRQPAAYCSPILVEHNDTRLIVTMTAESIIGIDADTGEFYWSIEQQQSNKIHANTPVYYDGKILCASSASRTDHSGTVLLQLSEDGKKVEVIWRRPNITNLMGGVILHEGYVYGAMFRSSDWYCLNWETGETEYISEGFKNGAMVYADGLYYCYNEDGKMALVDATPQEFNIISSFDIPLGTKEHWAHPVIHEGTMYVRHGNALMAYDIAKK